jgi:ABC-type multidrug transport system permease subunit
MIGLSIRINLIDGWFFIIFKSILNKNMSLIIVIENILIEFMLIMVWINEIIDEREIICTVIIVSIIIIIGCYTFD